MTDEEYANEKKAEHHIEFGRLFKNEKIYQSTLSPCPFCGDQKMLRILPQERKYWTYPIHTWQVQCQMCQASKELHESLESTILAWNRRPGVAGEDYWWFCKNLQKAGVEFPEDFFKGHFDGDIEDEG